MWNTFMQIKIVKQILQTEETNFRQTQRTFVKQMNVEYVHANQNSKTDFANRGNKLPTNSKNICKTIIQPLLLDKVIAYLFVTLYQKYSFSHSTSAQINACFIIAGIDIPFISI